jgi:formylglycine-generating enzyme required for sulfatase activity
LDSAGLGYASRAQDEFDLFIVHAEADGAWVQGFLLPAIGLDGLSVRTPDDFSAGTTVVEEFERAVTAARFTLLVLSRAFAASRWAGFAERLASHDNVLRESARVVPLVLERHEIPLRLDFLVRLDCTARPRWESEAARLRDLLHRSPPQPERLPCPYPGLRPFGQPDSELFFGRARETEHIVRLLRHHSLVAVVGPSGSGKSSLLRAGVLPRLQATEAERWLVRTLRPTSGALRALTDLIGGDGAYGSDERLRDQVDALLGGSSPDARLLLLVDQAESLFLPGDDRAALLGLLDRLRALPRCVVVLALRADFFGDLMTSVLWPLGPGERVEIAPLRGDALREAIVRPARESGVHLEPVLVERLLHDAGEEPAALPLLQETMVLLWERLTRRLLTVPAYESLGGGGRNGLTVALTTRADAVLARLSADQRRIARRICVRSVQLGVGHQDTRRPQTVRSLRILGEDPELFDATLRALTDSRLVTAGGGGDQEPTVELAHETMIGHWSTLRDWIAESRESEVVRRRIERDSEDWRHDSRDSGGLYRRRRLAEALDWARRGEQPLSRNATAFLAAGRRRRRLVWMFLWAVAAAAAAGVVWLSIAPTREWWLRHQAKGLSPTVSLAAATAAVGKDNRRVAFPALSVDVHEVSNEQYRYCVRASRCAAPLEPYDHAHFADGDRDLPVAYVTAYDAARFCSWLGRRLPTEDEWERVARGTDGRRYPWGNAPPRPDQVNAAVVEGRAPAGPVPVDAPAFAAGRSPDGVEHLIGNVAEWTATRVQDLGDAGVRRLGDWNGRDLVAGLAAKGGGWGTNAYAADEVEPVDPVGSFGDIGFRCVSTKG